jgi:hypothetical protein
VTGQEHFKPVRALSVPSIDAELKSEVKELEKDMEFVPKFSGMRSEKGCWKASNT